jgi:hypothetical protein
MHRADVIGAGSLDSLPHNGAVVARLALCGSRDGESYREIFRTAIVDPIISLVGVIGGPGSAQLINVERFAWRAVETISAFRRA